MGLSINHLERLADPSQAHHGTIRAHPNLRWSRFRHTDYYERHK